MTAGLSGPDLARHAAPATTILRSDLAVPGATLRHVVIAAGLVWAILFIVVGLRFELQMYGDGSIFAYAVAAQDAWAFHWHNIAARLFVYAYALLPSELIVAATGNARAGIALYGFLQFAAPLLGLGLTWAADRSNGRILFVAACLSTACLCPLVFGFPTEMWMAHALFWPALALCHHAGRGLGGTLAIFAVLTALVLTHEGALIFAVAILATLGLRGLSDPVFLRSVGIFALVFAIWTAVKIGLRPDAYIASVLARAEMNFIDVTNLTCALCLLLAAALAGYGFLFLALRRQAPKTAHIHAATVVALALVAYWLWFDQSLHTYYRYFVRTGLLIGTPVLGGLAAAFALRNENRLTLPVPWLPQVLAFLARPVTMRAIAGAVALVMFVHAVETAKFVTVWAQYLTAVQRLAMGTTSDPTLGDERFVSARRLGPDLNRVSWSSTTPFLSVLVAPNLTPSRLVIDPRGNYFWLTCRTAIENHETKRAVPAESRRLIRVHACLHR